MEPTSRIVLFPGLGATAQMYAGISALVPHVVVPPWLPVLGEDLPSYARRYVKLGMVRPNDVLGGSSFGGVLAQEIAHQLPVKQLLLMGTCRSAQGISPALRKLAPLARWLPIIPEHARLAHWPIALKFGATHPQHRQLLHDMIRSADSRLIRWSIQSITQWQGCSLPPIPIAHIHGSRDHLMPVHQSGADTIIYGAGHFIAVTHAPQVAAWIKRQLIT